jgi:hypothetical protein
MRNPDEVPVLVQLLVTGALPGCTYALQLGARELDQAQAGDGKDLLFRFALAFRPGRDGALVPRGPAVQGRGDDRFVYLCAGTSAGQRTSPWTRRAKVPLSGIVDLLPAPGLDPMPPVVQGRVAGLAKDGGPACASVKLLEGWLLASVSSLPGDVA